MTFAGVEHAITAWDRSTFIAINQGTRSWLFDRIMPPISDLGLGHIQVLAVLVAAAVVGALRGEVRSPRNVWTAVRSRSRWVLPLLLAFAISGLGATAFKHTVPRDRPVWFYYHEHEAGRELDVHVHTIEGRRPIRVRGFLSGHTATSTALAMAVTVLYWGRPRMRGWVVTCWALAALIGYSRIYIADHWPVDVVCGTLLGVASGWAAVWLLRWRERLRQPMRHEAADPAGGHVPAARAAADVRRRLRRTMA